MAIPVQVVEEGVNPGFLEFIRRNPHTRTLGLAGGGALAAYGLGSMYNASAPMGTQVSPLAAAALTGGAITGYRYGRIAGVNSKGSTQGFAAPA